MFMDKSVFDKLETFISYLNSFFHTAVVTVFKGEILQ